MQKVSYRFVGLVLLSFSLILLFRTAFYCFSGFDLTDEGFYLVSIDNPFFYPGSVTQFSFIYHPLYKLLGGNIGWFRIANLLVTFLLSWALVFVFEKTYLKSFQDNKWLGYITTFSIATISIQALILFGRWLPTPGYNTLCFQGLIITAIGFFLSQWETRKCILWGLTLIGFGGWLVFMAKPTSAIGLSLIVVVVLTLSRKINITFFLIPAFVSCLLLCLSAFLIDGGVTAFIERFKLGIQLAKIVDGRGFGSIFRFDPLTLAVVERNWLIICALLLSVGLLIVVTRNKKKYFLFLKYFLSICFIGFAGFFVVDILPHDMKFTRSIGFIFWSQPLALVFTISIYSIFKKAFRISLSLLVPLIFVLSLPYIYVLGTGANYWLASWPGNLFWQISGMFFVKSLQVVQRQKVLFLVAIGSLGFSSFHLNMSIENPYRQNSLKEKTSKESLGVSVLSHSQDYGDYFQAIYNFLNSELGSEFADQTPIIDMTGHSPGTVFALNGRSLGLAWLIGGYEGSDDLAKVALKLVPCEQLARAWILYEPDGSRRLSKDVISSFGGQIDKDYILVTTFVRPGSGSKCKQPCVQKLLKPQRAYSEALNNCLDLK
jgi:hypothetical protein